MRRWPSKALCCVRQGHLTCFACYGHPGVFANPIHHAIRRVREEGYQARMLPGISTLDCLFADLEIDPAIDGLVSFDATDFLFNERDVDASAGLILWQVGVIGDPHFRANGYEQDLVSKLAERLARFYPAGHLAYIYRAASLPWEEPIIAPMTIDSLATQRLSPLASVYLPPVGAKPTAAMERTPIAAMPSARDRDPNVNTPYLADPSNPRNSR